MKANIENRLQQIRSKEKKVEFLRKVYTPGNSEIADLILSLCENPGFDRDEGYKIFSSIARKEIAYAKKTGNTQRFRDVAKDLISYSVNGLPFDNLVVQFKDAVVAEYAVTMLNKQIKKHERPVDKYEFFDAIIDIAKAHGWKDLETKSLQEKLAIAMNDPPNVDTATETLVTLGRYNEAIDKYITAVKDSLNRMDFNERLIKVLNPRGSPYIEKALRIAQEHVPERVMELAKKGYSEYKIDANYAEAFLECARIIGKEDAATKRLVRYASRNNFYDVYEGQKEVVYALLAAGLYDTAKSLVDKVQMLVDKEKTNSYNQDLAELYYALGDKKTVKRLYTAIVNKAMKTQTDIDAEIVKAVELTGEKVFFAKKLLSFYEQQGYCKLAAGLASVMRDSKQAKTVNNNDPNRLEKFYSKLASQVAMYWG